jgi:hypothetical protein
MYTVVADEEEREGAIRQTEVNRLAKQYCSKKSVLLPEEEHPGL